jgi:NitT/TauT family transport system ATP-binding protein
MSTSKSQSNNNRSLFEKEEGEEREEGPMLGLRNVYKEYNQDNGNHLLSSHIILNNLNLDIREGEFVTIVGPSGCGKSTLLNILAGLDTAFKGDILVDSKPINESPDRDRIVVFQEGALFPWLTVYQNIEFGLKIAKVPSNQRKIIITKYIHLVQLSNFTNAFIHQLSGGMKQRVAIARALTLNPKILLMDEPFAAFDVQTRKLLYKEVLKIQQETNKTILFVTHNINEAVALGDRVIVMSPKLKNIKKEFIVDIPRPRNIDHPLIASISKEIVAESEDLFTTTTVTTTTNLTNNNNNNNKPELTFENVLSSSEHNFATP